MTYPDTEMDNNKRQMAKATGREKEESVHAGSN